MTNWEELKWRGLIKDTAGDDIEDKINNGEITFYLGTDPTADSLHVGHLSSFLISKRLKEALAQPLDIKNVVMNSESTTIGICLFVILVMIAM